ncbi:Smr/MutS family protein [Chloroflexota bacterium]
MAKIVLDLHDIYNKGFTIDAELNRVIVEAIEKKIALVEIIPGKGSGQLKKRVLRFLLQPEVKRLHQIGVTTSRIPRDTLQSIICIVSQYLNHLGKL